MALTWDDKTKLMASGREPNEEDAPYRERPPGGKPWEGYPKPYEPKLAGKGIDLGGGRSLGAAEIQLLREIYPSASEKEKDRLIKMYGNKWMQSDASSRQIRDRLKPFTHGKGYDDAGGSLRGVPDALRIQLLRDAKA